VVKKIDDEALRELEDIRPLLADGFGAESAQIRNLDKQIGRLRSALAPETPPRGPSA
jgi:hypothetical protein